MRQPSRSSRPTAKPRRSVVRPSCLQKLHGAPAGISRPSSSAAAARRFWTLPSCSRCSADASVSNQRSLDRSARSGAARRTPPFRCRGTPPRARSCHNRRTWKQVALMRKISAARRVGSSSRASQAVQPQSSIRHAGRYGTLEEILLGIFNGHSHPHAGASADVHPVRRCLALDFGCESAMMAGHGKCPKLLPLRTSSHFETR